MNKEKQTDSYQLLKSLNFAVIDLETTGGDHKKDKIIEIGVSLVQNMKVTKTKGWLINPEVPIPHFVQKLTKITQQKIAKSPTIEAIIDEIRDFIGDDCILVAHNSDFDITFLNATLKRYRKKIFESPVICTNIMTKYLIPEISHSNLPYMCDLMKIPLKQAHRASADAQATAKLLIEYLKFFGEKNITKINQLYYPRNKFELDRIHIKSYDQLAEVIHKVSLFDCPFTITIKGKTGQFLGHYPFAKPPNDKKVFNDIIENKKWDTISFRLVGSPFESITSLHEYKSILKQEYNTEIQKFILKHKLFQTKKSLKNIFESNQTLEKRLIITPHLITNQFLLYDVNLTMRKHALNFKYPSHWTKIKKVIDNYFKDKHWVRPSKNSPLNFSPLPEILQNELTNNSQIYFEITEEQYRDHKGELLTTLEKYLEIDQSLLDYPIKHL